MIRNLKALGLVLVALFAFSAVAASGASAQGKLTAPEPVTLIGTETGATFSNSFTAFGGRTHCPGSTMTGHKVATTPHGLVPNGAASVTLTPHYKNCVIEDAGGNKFPLTIDMNGCDYEIKSGETGGKEEYIGTGGVVCPVGKEVQMTTFSSASHALRLCTVSTSNSGSAGSKVTNTLEGGDIDIVGTLIGFVSKKSGLCGAGTDESGQLHIDATVKGFNASGVQKAISITD